MGATRRRRPTGEVRQRLLEEGSRLFAQRGYESTSQREVAAAAGVSTSVLFRHFPSKARLLVEAVIEPFGQFVADIAPALQAASEGTGQAELFMTELGAHLEPHKDRLRILLATLQSPDGDDVMAEVSTHFAPLFDVVLATPRAGAGTAADETDLRVRLVVGTMTTLVVFRDWFLAGAASGTYDHLAEALGRMASRSAGEPGDPGRPGRLGDSSRPGPPAGDPVTGTGGAGGPAGVPLVRPVGGNGAGSDLGRRRNSDEVRQAMLASAGWLFLDRGYSSVGLADVAGDAQTSESVLFRHFDSKPRLFIEAIFEPFAGALAELAERSCLLERSPGGPSREVLVRDLYDFARTNRATIRTVMSVCSEPDHREIDETVAGWFARLYEQLWPGTGDPAVDQAKNLRMRVALAMILSAAVLDDWFLPDQVRFGPARTLSVMSQLIGAQGEVPAHH